MKAVNIIYAGDIFRDSSRHAEVFFHQLIETPIKIALGIDPNSPPFRDLRIRDNRFDPATFLELSQATGWVKNYFSVPSAAEEYFFRSIPSDSVIIGYEMPPWLLTSLVRRAFRYIDFRISPIRFSRDMYVALESNLAIFGTAMNEFAVAQEEIFLEASLIKARVRHNETIDWTRTNSFSERKMVFVGQTELDASLLSDDEQILTIEHFINKIRDLTANVEVSYKPHPYARSFSKQEKSKLQEIIGRKISTEKRSMYSLLGSFHNYEFIAISSGSNQEAPYFGKKSHTLFRPICNLDESDHTRPRYFQVKFWDFISPRLWSSVLGNGTMPTALSLPLTPESTMRRLYNAWWGYDDHEFEEDLFWKRLPFKSIQENSRVIKRKFIALLQRQLNK